MSFPPPPIDTIDWNNIGFKVREVSGHVESHFSVKTAKWSEAKFVEDPFLRIHGLAPGLNYGQQAYEGMKAFRDPSDHIHIFRPTQNAARMANSATFISIPPVPSSHFLKCVHLAVSLNAAYVPPHHTGAAMYIRPLLFGSSAQLGLNPPEEFTFLVYVLPVGVYHGVHPVDALILEEFDRAAPEGTGAAKVGGNYAPVLRWSEKALKEGFGITLHLDSKTRSAIEEFSTSAFIGLKKTGDGDGDYTLVVPNSKNVIKSVTSDSCVEIGKSFGWNVEIREDEIPYTELHTFTEILAAGTAAALVPIKSITHRTADNKFTYGDGTDDYGSAFTRLLTTLRGIQQGKLHDTFGWRERVQEPEAYGWKAIEAEADGPDGINTVGQLP
ncbi:MAG: hypothetical protein M1833_006394 [Piccolia ochrophora]|nr:MAG: hypothetical protein M1833_006394 [Piccolia ochrophora]